MNSVSGLLNTASSVVDTANKVSDTATSVVDSATKVSSSVANNTNQVSLEDSVREYMLVAVNNPDFINKLSEKIGAIIEPILKYKLESFKLSSPSVTAPPLVGNNVPLVGNNVPFEETNTNETTQLSPNTLDSEPTSLKGGSKKYASRGSKKYASRGRRTTRRRKQTSR